MKQYLPTKKFQIIIGVFVVLVLGIFLISSFSSSKLNFLGNTNNESLKIENQTVLGLVQNDTDGDTIPDWEEALWGTDKYKTNTFGEMPDAKYIENKKLELKIENAPNDKKLTETDKFAREFFSAFTAMKASGEVDSETVNAFSNALGQRIINPALEDKFSITQIKISENINTKSKKEYYTEVKNIFEGYVKSTGLGNELEIVSGGLSTYSATGKTTQYDELVKISNGYKDFANKIMRINVPKNLVDYHIRIANNAYNTGISVLNMTKIINDSVVGLGGLSQYQKYSNALMQVVEELKANL